MPGGRQVDGGAPTDGPLSPLTPPPPPLAPQAQKKALREAMGEANASREASRIALRELRSTVKFSSLEGIDAAIKALESRQSHDSLSLSEEKRVIEEIARLKKSRASIGQLAEASQKLEAGDAQRGDMVSDLKSLDQRIDALKAREAELRSQLDGLRAKEGDKGDQYPALQQEEVDCREVCKAAYKKMVDLRAAHNEAWTAFKAANELYRAQTQADRKRQYEERQKARAEKDAYYAALRAEHAPEPFEEQIVAADQLASYIKGLDGSRRAEEGKEAGKPVAAAELPAGLKPLVKKDTDEKDAWMLGDGKSKRAAKGKRVGGAEARGADAGKLVHSLDILQAFAALGVDVPLTREAAVRGLGAVEAKKAEFLSMRQAAKAEAEAEAARKEAAGEAEGQDKKEGEAGEKEGEPDEKEENAEAQRRDEKKEKKPAAAKKPAQAPPRLDDVSSWPAMGGSEAGAAPAAAPAAQAEEPVEEAAEKPVEEPVQAANGGSEQEPNLKVELSVNGDDVVEVGIAEA